MEKERKIKSYLGFAQKSRNALIGADNILKSKKQLYLVLVDNAASDRLKRNLSTLHTKLVFVDELSALCNRQAVKAIGVTEKNLADAIIGQIRGRI